MRRLAKGVFAARLLVCAPAAAMHKARLWAW